MRALIAVCIVLVATAASGSPIMRAPGADSWDTGAAHPPVEGREIKWEQYPADEWAILAQHSPTLGQLGEVADDFLCDDPDPIRAIEWWGYYSWEENPTGEYFMIRFYAMAAGAVLPGSLLYEEPCYVFTKEIVPDPIWDHFFRYTQNLTVPFAQVPGTTYWISIQQISDFGDLNWYWMGCHPDYWWGSEHAFRSAHLGFPNWTPSTLAHGVPVEMAFVLYDEIVSPVEARSWSSIKAMYR
jgi:hypothetical protein